MARNKGAAGERELSKILTDELGFVVQRKLGQARDGGDDIQIGQYRIEVKRRERVQADDWAQQVEATCQLGDVPIVAYRRNGQPWRCIVPLDWVIEQIRETVDSGKPRLQTGSTGDD
jgi:Holliday junction resolvase